MTAHAQTQLRRQALLKLIARHPRDTVELRRVSGLPRETLKNDLKHLADSGAIARLGFVRKVRQGGSRAVLWGLPGATAFAPRTVFPTYAFKTRWVTVNPYNPEPSA